ncbi:fibulin-1-like isoform X2 [Euwallacea similis]|uniref:fibulin-1-like isoform X2 n=1 Tax=Euwallacea similis TaxID=1736056 RepID=UPI003450E4A8
MECTNSIILIYLLMVCTTTMIFAQRGQDLNGYCLDITQCKKIGYICSNNKTCQCRRGYRPNGEWTKCVVVGSKCFYDSQCTEGAYCTGAENFERCRCKDQDNFYTSEDNLHCVNSSYSIIGKSLAVIMSNLSLLWAGVFLINGLFR